MVDQSVSFVEYQHIAGLLNEIATTITKAGQDFWDGVEDGMFDKITKPGEKGSSVMPQKKNPWLCEGGIKILGKGAVMLQYSTREMRLYHFEGDMGRSILVRDMPSDYARIVLGMRRIMADIQNYEPNEENIRKMMDDNPGMSSAPIMAVLKRAQIGGDAYRLMQKLSHDPQTGIKRTQEEYDAGIRQFIADMTIPTDVAENVLMLLEPSQNLGYAAEFSASAKRRCIDTIAKVRELYELEQ